jgi:hypothetical protein
MPHGHNHPSFGVIIVLLLAVGENGSGTRVIRPPSCHIGDDNCTFRLDLYDADNCRVHVGGLLFNLTLQYWPLPAADDPRPVVDRRRLSAPFTDNRNGSFTATINSSWVVHQGSHEFRFFHAAAEFSPTMTVDNVKAANATQLRTIEFLPRRCPPQNHTLANTITGATCDRCQPGFIADENRSVRYGSSSS